MICKTIADFTMFEVDWTLLRLSTWFIQVTDEFTRTKGR